MPLSEEELRLLEQMEQALAEEDPKFASALRGRALGRSVRLRTILASVGFVAGLATLLGGAVSQLTWLGIVGFVVMLASATFGVAAWSGRHTPAEAPHRELRADDALDAPRGFQVIDGGRASRPGRQRRSRQASGSFMQRMEERWQRRRDQGL